MVPRSQEAPIPHCNDVCPVTVSSSEQPTLASLWQTLSLELNSLEIKGYFSFLAPKEKIHIIFIMRVIGNTPNDEKYWLSSPPGQVLVQAPSWKDNNPLLHVLIKLGSDQVLSSLTTEK